MKTRDSKAYARTVRKVDRLLHQSLAERAASDNHSPVIVLNSTGEDLARRRAALIDQYGKPDVLEYTTSISLVVLAITVEAFHIDDKVTLIEEKVGQQQGLVEITAGIVPEIEYHMLHSQRKQFQRSVQEFTIGRAGEL